MPPPTNEPVVTHPLWRPFDPAATAARASRRVASRQVPVDGVHPPRSWERELAAVLDLITGALGSDVLALDHVGSTSVAGLAAKPILDLDLAVADSADEPSYAPRLTAAGFRLIAREPEWEEHRCFTLGHPNTNLHVFSPGAIEPRRHLAFRDWLAAHPDDLRAYASSKGTGGFRPPGISDTDYNGGKVAVVYDIYERIFAADPRYPHDPHPR